MRACSLITFDVVNTIIKVRGSPGIQYAKVANQNGMTVQAEVLDKVYKDVWHEKKAEHPVYGIHHGIAPKDWWHDFVIRVFTKAGYNSDRKQLSDVSRKIWKHYNDCAEHCWDILPHSEHVLQKIKCNGYKLGVISNFDERLQPTLEALSLVKYFDFFVNCILAQCAKPDRRIFEEALKLGNVGPQQCLHVGDDVREDYFAARELGINAVLLVRENKLTSNSTDFQSIPQKHIVTDIRDILDKLKEI